MTLSNRIEETTKKFNQKQEEHESLLKQADACLEEMHRLQGEYRVLAELLEADIPEASDPAKTIEVKPAKGKK